MFFSFIYILRCVQSDRLLAYLLPDVAKDTKKTFCGYASAAVCPTEILKQKEYNFCGLPFVS